MNFLAGYTGFVGSNLFESFKFDGVFNSKNIEEAFYKNPNVLYYSAVPAQKFIANEFPLEDKKTIDNAIENIKKINPKSVVLISTVDIYEKPNGKDEDFDTKNQHPETYGKNRLFLEDFVKDNFSDYLIVRLPGLYGKNLKKNFIYDFIKYIPAMLTNTKINELAQKREEIYSFYTNQNNGFYKLNDDINVGYTRKIFEILGFSALNFTDSRGMFQYYNLKYLFNDIQKARENNIKILNIATEPVLISDIYKTLTGNEFVNEFDKPIPYYNFKTKHDKIFNGQNGYIQNRDFVLNDIKEFVEKELKIERQKY